MGNASASMLVMLEKDRYRPGEVVKGYLEVDVKEELECTNVYAILVGTTQTYVRYKYGKDYKLAMERSNFVEDRVCIGTFPGVAKPGLYQLPFQFKLDDDAPSTADTKQGNLDSYGAIMWEVRGHAERPGKMTFDIKQSCPFEVVPGVVSGAQSAEAESAPIEEKEDNKDVELCMCIPKGPMKLKCSLSSNVLFHSEAQAIDVRISLQNPSSQAISKVKIDLCENVKVRADGQYAAPSQSVYSLGVDGVLGGMNVEKTVSFSLPPDLKSWAFRAPKLEVSHYLQVRAATKWPEIWINTPCVKFPVKVSGPPLDAEAAPEVREEYKVNSEAMGSPILVKAEVVRSGSGTLPSSKDKPVTAVQATVVQGGPPSQMVMGKQEQEQEPKSDAKIHTDT